PCTIHFASTSPIRALPRLATPVLFAQPRHGCVFGGVPVLHPLLRFLPCSGTEVGANVRLRAEHLGVLQELVSTETIALDSTPRHLQTRRPLVTRSDAILPVIVGGEVAARPAKDANVQILRGFQNILAIAVRIRETRALFEYSAVNATAEVLDEV